MEVTEASYDEPNAVWHVTARSADGTRQELSARVLVTAVGVLNRPTEAVLVLVTLAALYGLRQFVKMRYTDYVFEAMRPDDLPRDTYNVFNDFTPQFMQLGGGLVGDYRLAYSPRPVFIRYFLPPDDRVKAQVSDWDGKFTPSFTIRHFPVLAWPFLMNR